MKNIFYTKGVINGILGFAIVVILMSCEKDKNEFDPNLYFVEDTIFSSNLESQFTVDFVTNIDWNASSDVDWIKLDHTSGTKGKQELNFTIDENNDDQRMGNIGFVINGDESKEIKVIQEAGNRDDIYVTPDGQGDGYSWEEATNLEQALKLAVSGNVIHISEGVYKPSESISGGDQSDRGDLTFQINKYIGLKGGYPQNSVQGTESDPSKYKTILSGDNMSYHVVTISAPNVKDQKVILEGLTISNGNASDQNTSVQVGNIEFPRNYGGGVTIGNANVEIRDVIITNNQSGKFVSGLYAFGGSIVTIDNCQVNNNVSKGNVGGVWIRESVAHVYNSEFIGNHGGTAAGFHAYPDAKVYLYNSIIADNKGNSFGAAFYAREGSEGVLVNCLISGNESTSTHGGGGVMMYNNCNVTIISSTITGNMIKGPGGGVYRRSGENILGIYNSIISGNEQIEDGVDVDVYEEGALLPIIKSSAIGGDSYDMNEMIISSAGFNVNSMLDDNYVPIEENNPAMKFGMNKNELVELVNNLDKEIEEKYLGQDLWGSDREGINIMGAIVDLP